MIIQLEQARQNLRDIQPKIDELGASLNVDTLRKKCQELEELASAPDFWNDPDNSQKILGELKATKDTVTAYDDLTSLLSNTLDFLDLVIADEDESFTDDILNDIRTIEKSYEEQKIKLLLSGEYDRNNAIVSIHPGAGGTEAQDWAEMLYRMYVRFGERRGF